MQPQTIRSNEVQYSIKEIRQKHRLEYKKMTRSAKARILDKKNDSSYLPLAGDSNKLSFHNSNTNWANYVFEVDGKTYSSNNDFNSSSLWNNVLVRWESGR